MPFLRTGSTCSLSSLSSQSPFWGLLNMPGSRLYQLLLNMMQTLEAKAEGVLTFKAYVNQKISPLAFTEMLRKNRTKPSVQRCATQLLGLRFER